MFHFIFTQGHVNDPFAEQTEIEWSAEEAAEYCYNYNIGELYNAVVKLIEDGTVGTEGTDAIDTLVDETEDIRAIAKIIGLIPEEVVKVAAKIYIEENENAK